MKKIHLSRKFTLGCLFTPLCKNIIKVLYYTQFQIFIFHHELQWSSFAK